MNKERAADSLMAAAAAAAASNNANTKAMGQHQHHRRSGSSSNLPQMKQRAGRRVAGPNYCMSDVMARYGPAGKAAHGHAHGHAAASASSNNAPMPAARPFPIVSFNHLSREVLDYETSRDFYCGVLGFIEIPRPAFENDGVWLYGFGLSLHLIKSKYPQKRMLLKGRRIGACRPAFVPVRLSGRACVEPRHGIDLPLTDRRTHTRPSTHPPPEHFEEALPNVDHMAFITSNLNEVEKQLREHNVFYKRVRTAARTRARMRAPH